jgi:addiction module HigA family antidote
MRMTLKSSTTTERRQMQFHEIHPGITLKEELETRGIAPAAAALKLRVPPQRLHEIVRGERAITPDTALRLSRFFGTSAEFWMTLQSNYDLALARRERGARIEAEVEVAA